MLSERGIGKRNDNMAKDQRENKQYESLRADDNDDVLSDLDVFDKDYLHHPRPRRERVLAALQVQPYRWLLDIVLVLAVIGLLVERHHRGGNDTGTGNDESSEHRFEGTGDLTGYAPRCKLRVGVLFSHSHAPNKSMHDRDEG